MESMRRLHFGHQKEAEFTAHVHILDLHNVPLVEGDCRIKWKFSNGMSLNTSNNDKVMGQALQTSISYLKELRNAATAGPNEAGTNGTMDNNGDMLRSPTLNGDGDHHKVGGRLKDVLLHPQRTLRASTISHHSTDQQPPRTRTQSMPKSPSQYPESPSSERANNNMWRTTSSTDYFPINGEPASEESTRPGRPPGQSDYFGGNVSPPASPKTSSITNNILSPTTTIRPTQSRPQQNLLSPIYSPSHSRQANSSVQNAFQPTAPLTRQNTAVSDTNRTPSLPRLPTSLGQSLAKAGMPSKAEVKGKTRYMPLEDNAVRFDKHMICAVAIPMQKNSKHLAESVVKLKVLYKVRTTPMAEKIGSRPAPTKQSADLEQGSAEGSSAMSAVRSHKTRINGSSVSVSVPVSSGVSTVHINAKEAHEEIVLGDLQLNLSEFVSVDFATDRLKTGARPGESWITRRYLLQNGRTNALLRIAVKMDWISGVRDFTAPPLTKGQIISPKKQSSRYSRLANDAKTRDKDRGSIHSGQTGSSSKLYLQGQNASSKSLVSLESENAHPRGGPSWYKHGDYLHHDSSSEAGSVLDGRAWLSSNRMLRSRRGNGQANPQDTEQMEMDFINEIFETEDTPPSSPQFTPEKDRPLFWSDDSVLSTGHLDSRLTSTTLTSDTSSKVHSHSPAQALAFFHRNKDKTGRTKTKSTQKEAESDGKGRARIHSAPSRSLLVGKRAASKSSNIISLPPDQDWDIHAHGAAPVTPHYHHHHHHHHEEMPVLVHVPTRQEPLDIHSHPFRWKGKPTPGMHAMTHVSHSIHAHGESSSGYAAEQDHPKHRNATVDVGVIQQALAGDEADKRKRAGTTPAAIQILKRPFKARSGSIASSVASSAHAPSIVSMPAALDTTSDLHASGDASNPSRGSMDLQRTLRPGQANGSNPLQSNLRRTISPGKMTAAEEEELQRLIKKSGYSSQAERSAVENDPPRSDRISEKLLQAELASDKTMYEILKRVEEKSQKRMLRNGGTPSSRTSQASSSSNSRSSSHDRLRKLIRHPTDEVELDARAQSLRARGLLPTLSITTSDALGS